MFITGPEVIQDRDRRGSRVRRASAAMTHNSKSGVAHFAADDEESCPRGRALPDELPAAQQHGAAAPLGAEAMTSTTRGPELDTFVPDDPNKPQMTCRQGRGEDRR